MEVVEPPPGLDFEGPPLEGLESVPPPPEVEPPPEA